jgi:hypothetical protein
MAEQSYSNLSGYSLGSMDISGANSVTQIFPRPFRVMTISLICGVATATAAETMTISRRKYPGSAADASDAVTIGTFSVVATLVAGDEVRVDLSSSTKAEFNAGEEIKILCGNSTGTGTVYFLVQGYHFPSGPTPQSSFSSTAKAVSGSGTIKYAAFTAS